jgi:hypothetical protein
MILRYAIRTMIVVALFACSTDEEANGESTAFFPPEPLTVASSDSGALRLAVRTAPSQPPARGTCAMELVITDARGAPKDGLVVEVVPWMPSHLHGASVRPTVEPKGDGHYLVHNASFYMPGDWELRLTVSGPLSDHAAVKMTVP